MAKSYTIDLTLVDDGRRVLARIDNPAIDAIPEVAVLEALRASKWANFVPIAEGISRIARSHDVHLRRLTVLIAERRDGRAQAEISDDGIEGYLTVEPPAGGEPIAPSAIRLALAQAGVKTGVDAELLERAERDGRADRCVVAVGKAPQPGKDAAFELLFEVPSEVPAQHGSGEETEEAPLAPYFFVDEGQPLMRRHPAVPGMRGLKVSGEILLPPPVNDVRMVASAGTRISEQDPNLLVAATRGTPKVLSNSVRVDLVFEAPMVHSGNSPLTFDGSVMIRGNVGRDGYVDVTGSLKVGGGVEAAVLKAGGDIDIRFGVHGRGTGEVRAPEGLLRARFLDQAEVEARDVKVSDAITGCDITVSHAVEAGFPTGRGQISGGRIRALTGVRAKVLGSPAGAETVLEVGVGRAVSDKLANIRTEMSATRELLARLTKSREQLEKLQHASKALQLELLEEQYRRAHSRMRALSDDEGKLAALVDRTREALVVVTQKIYSKVSISFSGRDYVVKEELPPSRFILRKNTVVREPLLGKAED